MKKKRIKDPEFKVYIEGLPCYICGHKADGYRSIYSEYTDTFKKKPCKNTAHHCDVDMTRAKNDHRVLPLCGHYVISGKGTCNCHNIVHSEGVYKTKESLEKLSKDADKYYEEYLKLKEN